MEKKSQNQDGRVGITFKRCFKKVLEKECTYLLDYCEIIKENYLDLATSLKV